MRQLQAEATEVSHMIAQTKHTFEEQMTIFRKMVGDRASVPKEEVYPRFQMFARLWLAVHDERDKNSVRSAVYQACVVVFVFLLLLLLLLFLHQLFDDFIIRHISSCILTQ
jgi:hypothetical protein